MADPSVRHVVAPVLLVHGMYGGHLAHMENGRSTRVYLSAVQTLGFGPRDELVSPFDIVAPASGAAALGASLDEEEWMYTSQAMDSLIPDGIIANVGPKRIYGSLLALGDPNESGIEASWSYPRLLPNNTKLRQPIHSFSYDFRRDLWESLQALVDAYVTLVDHYKRMDASAVIRPIIVGHSMGGMLVQAFLRRFHESKTHGTPDVLIEAANALQREMGGGGGKGREGKDINNRDGQNNTILFKGSISAGAILQRAALIQSVAPFAAMICASPLRGGIGWVKSMHLGRVMFLNSGLSPPTATCSHASAYTFFPLPFPPVKEQSLECIQERVPLSYAWALRPALPSPIDWYSEDGKVWDSVHIGIDSLNASPRDGWLKFRKWALKRGRAFRSYIEYGSIDYVSKGDGHEESGGAGVEHPVIPGGIHYIRGAGKSTLASLLLDGPKAVRGIDVETLLGDGDGSVLVTNSIPRNTRGVWIAPCSYEQHGAIMSDLLIVARRLRALGGLAGLDGVLPIPYSYPESSSGGEAASADIVFNPDADPEVVPLDWDPLDVLDRARMSDPFEVNQPVSAVIADSLTNTVNRMGSWIGRLIGSAGSSLTSSSSTGGSSSSSSGGGSGNVSGSSGSVENGSVENGDESPKLVTMFQ